MLSSRMFLRLDRLLISIVTVFGVSCWWINQSLPTPTVVQVSHPGFDSSKILFKKKSIVVDSPNKHPQEHQDEHPHQHPTNTGNRDYGGNTSQLQPQPKPTRGICDEYKGVLHIQSGDAGGAAGTIFFIYVVNQLIYAEKYNLLPWIHLNNMSQHIFDPIVHSNNQTIEFQMMHGMTIDFVSDGYRHFGFGSYPGPPKKLLENQPLTSKVYSVDGTGVWNHYFEPVSKFDPTVICHNKPLVRMHYYHLNPGLQIYCPWSVKSWPYNPIPKRLAPATTLQDWYEPMRKRGSEIVSKYYRFRSELIQQVEILLPPSSSSSNCMAMHVRHSDKAGTNRKKIPLEAFLPYAEAYLHAGGTTIFLATDSLEVLSEISTKWPRAVRNSMIWQSNDMLRSSDRKPVFVIGQGNHHRTNTEVLVDILAMSKCQFFVHGFSAVSEAVMYLNFDLHYHSVDLEEHPLNHRLEPKDFEILVKQTLSKNIKGKT